MRASEACIEPDGERVYPHRALTDRVDSRLRALTILRAGAARKSDGADDLAAHHDRQPAVDGNGALDPQHAHAFAAGGEHVLEGFRRPLEPRGRARLLLADDRAAERRVV